MEKPIVVKATHEAAHAVVEAIHGSAPRMIHVAPKGDSHVDTGWRDGSISEKGRPVRNRKARAAAEAVVREYFAGAVAVRRFLLEHGSEADVVYEGGRLLASGFAGHDGDDEHARTIAFTVWPDTWKDVCATLLEETIDLLDEPYVWRAIVDVAAIATEHLRLDRVGFLALPSVQDALTTHGGRDRDARRSLYVWTARQHRV